MNALLRHCGRFLATIGLDPRRPFRAIKAWPYYRNDRKEFVKQHDATGNKFGPLGTFPILTDRFDESGSVRSHYFRQDLHVAQRVFHTNPKQHVDVGSRLDGFVGSLASFREVVVLDFRPQPVKLRNITFRQADLMSELPLELIGCTDSLSCLHTIEHFGLGRYGDPIRYDGHLVGWRNLTRILSPGGRFHFSTPIGRQRIEFNAHRVFGVPYLLEMFKESFELVQCSYISDEGELHENVDPHSPEAADSWGCLYGCGIFELVKKSG